jgi:DNA-binding response OmpR family regulator
MKKIIFYSPDFSMCYSLLMYLQDRYNVTTSTDLGVLKIITKEYNFDLVILDAEPTADILELCRSIKSANSGIPLILTYVYKKQIQEMDNSIRQYVSSIFYKPFDLTEVSSKLNSLVV